MRTPGIVFAFVSVLALACPSTAGAQVGYLWSPAELVAESDVVAVCEHVSTMPTGVKTEHPELGSGLPVDEMVSTLKVLALLKGSADGDLVVRHYWITEERRTRGLVNTGSELRFPAKRGFWYLVFLRQMPDGRYAPTTGYTFPTTSVQRLVQNGMEK